MIFFKNRKSRDGYTHPSLKQAFNDAALSPKGLAHINHCRDTGFPLIVCDSFEEKIHGDCTPEKMRLLAGANFRSLVHEARHAFQMATMGVRGDTVKGALPIHIIRRMMEADAAAFANIVAIERWKTLGYTSVKEMLTEEIKDATYEEFVGMNMLERLKSRPGGEERVMYFLFHCHYHRLQDSPSYESNFRSSAGVLYSRIETDLSMWKWFPFPSAKRRAQIIEDFQNPEKEIRAAMEKLGRVLTLEKNYITEGGPKLPMTHYTQAFRPGSKRFHEDWQQRINTIIAEKYAPGR